VSRRCARRYSRAPGRLAAWLAATALLLAACGQAVDPVLTPATEPAPTATTTLAPATAVPPAGSPTLAAGGQPTTRPTAEPAPTAGSPTQPPALPQDTWRTAELRDVRTGETFTLNDLAGRLVVVEPMAIWCTNCRAQQDAAREALASLQSNEIVYISLDVDPNESEADLARYADERGYPWHFVVASRDVARSLAQSFGDQILSPPSTPEVLIAPDGSVEASFGFASAEQLAERFAAGLP